MTKVAKQYNNGEHGMSLSKERIMTIENLTMDQPREAYGSEEITPPIDLDKITATAHNGLKIMGGDFKDLNISDTYDRTVRTIFVKKSDPLFRKVFTVAHELGHHHLHANKPRKIFYRQDLDQLAESDEKDQEQEANWFAASLLIPKNVFIRFWIIKDIDELASRFGVSNQAAYYRPKNLSMI